VYVVPIDERINKKNARITSAFFGDTRVFCTKGDSATLPLKLDIASLKGVVDEPAELGVLAEPTDSGERILSNEEDIVINYLHLFYAGGCGLGSTFRYIFGRNIIWLVSCHGRSTKFYSGRGKHGHTHRATQWCSREGVAGFRLLANACTRFSTASTFLQRKPFTSRVG